jgi:anaerobic magnesium-protoporphyrin IX monomethyl ester cyclase
MTDVLLAHGYFLDEDPKEREIMKPYPPLGLLYVAAYLRREGLSVEVFDTTFATRDEPRPPASSACTRTSSRGNRCWTS